MIDRSCMLCGDPLTIPQRLLQRDELHPICENIVCQQSMRELRARRLLDDAFALQQARNLVQRRRATIERGEAWARRYEKLSTQQASIAIKVISDQLPEESLEGAAVIQLPWLTRPLRETPPERVALYRDHLRERAEDALDIWEDEDGSRMEELLSEGRPSEPVDLDPTHSAVLDNTCALCQGGCCTVGGTQAFIKTADMLRRLQEDPSRTVDDLVDIYLAYLPEKSIHLSCVNQTTSGCALPREIRGDVCNGFYCESQLKLGAPRPRKDMPDKVVVIQREGSHWNQYSMHTSLDVSRVAVIEGDQRRLLDLDLTRFDADLLDPREDERPTPPERPLHPPEPES